MGFKNDFVCGVSNATYQIIGATYVERNGLNVCDN